MHNNNLHFWLNIIDLGGALSIAAEKSKMKEIMITPIVF
jgi:hypothetical protein